MDEEYDLLKLFTAACLASGKDPDQAFRDAVATANLYQQYVEEQLDFFGLGDDDGSS